MIRDDAVALIAFRLGDRTDINARIINEMILQQQSLEAGPTLPWFLLTEIATAIAYANSETVGLPPDFLRESEEESALWIYDPNADEEDQWIEIIKKGYDDIKTRFTGTGQPLRYAITGGCIRLRPMPDVDYTLKMLYYAKDQSLATNIENKWLKHATSLLIGKTGVALAASMGNAAALTLFQADVALGLSQIHIDNVAREEANRERHMGEAP